MAKVLTRNTVPDQVKPTTITGIAMYFVVFVWLFLKSFEGVGISSAITSSSLNRTAISSNSPHRHKDHNCNSLTNITDLKLAFIGDSLSRHQYLSLIYYLQTGSWEIPDARYIEGNMPSRREHKTLVSATLNNTNACDCYRPEGHYRASRRVHQMYENMYYHNFHNSNQVGDDGNYIIYISKYGSLSPAKGHWDPTTLYSMHAHHVATSYLPTPLDDQGNPPPYTWQGNWSYVVRNLLARLRPHPPKYVVINAGLWPHSEFYDNITLPELQDALQEHGMIGIYKTTTKNLDDNSTSILEKQDQIACEILPYCLDLSWTGNLTDPAVYADALHFKAPVYARFNRQLLELIQEIENTSADTTNAAIKAQIIATD